MSERSIFQTALEISIAAERAAYLDQACGKDTPLRHQVEALLREHEAAGSFLERPPAPVSTEDLPNIVEGPGSIIGPYKLLQTIGEGGFGVVYMAEQEHPVRRRVALKIVKPGMDSRQVIARFEAERQALAMMDHQNIARVYDAGTTEHGRPYFVMELVHGIPITRYCDENHLSMRERLELFVPVCQAIQHAHQKGIIHRDIKPSNVLVTLYDSKPVPKVIDFGVAKAIEQRLTNRTMFTQYGTVVGTFEYMAPEQAEMSALGVDTRSDIYSLGVLLYELLTGTTPLERKRLRDAGYSEAVKMIKEEEPPRPSTRISASQSLPLLAAARNTDPGKLAKLVRGELDWIVMKCLEKDRARRYETANGLARDVQRYLNDEPIEACPPSKAYRFRKFARKNRAAFVITAGFLLVLIVGAMAASWQAVRATRAEAEAIQQRDAAAKALARAQAVSDFFSKELLGKAAPEFSPHNDKVTAEELLLRAGEKLDRQQTLKDQPEVEATLRNIIGYTLFKLGALPEAAPHLEKAVRLRQAIDPNHPDTLTAQEDLAFYLTTMRRTAEAVELAEKTWKARRELLGPTHHDTLESLDTYAGTLTLKGDYEQAERYRRECLTEREKLGDRNASYHQSLGNSAWDLNEQGKHDLAEPIIRKCIKLRKAVNPKDPELMQLLNNLGVALSHQGKFDDSVATARESLALGKELVAPRSFQRLYIQHTLLLALFGAGKWKPELLEEAEQLGRDTFEGRQERLSPSSVHVGRTQVLLGLVLAERGKQSDAERAFREARTIFRDKPNQEDWIAMAEAGRGAMLVALGRATDAEKLLVAAWPQIMREPRIPHWQKERLRDLIAAAYAKTGNKDEAARWRAISIQVPSS